MKLMSTLAVKGVLDELLPAFERASGHKVAISYDPTAAMIPRIDGGERADVTILTTTGIDRLIAQGVLAAGSRVDLARSSVGIAVRQGAPKPDIATPDAFRRALLAASSIVYSRAGASGIFFVKLIERLGIAREIEAKAVVVPAGFTGETVAEGKAEIAVQQVSELMVTPGIDLVGPLPHELQEYLDFAGGVFASAPEAAIARQFLSFLSAPEHAEVYRRRGVTQL